jgi:hypothetical protein
MALDKWTEAEELVTQSLAIAETLEDRATIAFNIAKLGQVAQGRGDLERARRHYQAGLAMFEQLGMPEAEQVRQMLAGLAGESGEGAAAGVTLEEALLALTRAAIGAAEGQHPVQAVAATIEQLAAQPELPPGYAAYLQALAAAVRQPQPAHLDQLYQAALGLPIDSFDAALFLSLARLCDRHDYPQGAVLAQAQAISRLRQQGDAPAVLQPLSVALYNQAGYLAQLDRFDEAVAALAEVVAIDEHMGLADLESDRAVLAQMQRRRAGLPPQTPPAEAGLDLAGLEAQMAKLPPEAQAAARQALAHLAAMSPAERVAALLAMQQANIEQQATAIVEAVRQARQANQVAALLPQLAAAAHLAEGEAPRSAYAGLAQFVEAVIALLRGEPLPPVPPAYAGPLAALQEEE